MKLRIKIKPEDIRKMRGNMFKLKQMGKDCKCGRCSRKFTEDEAETFIGMVIFKPELKKTNTVICMDCVYKLESLGVVNMEHDIKNIADKKEDLKKEYREQLKELGIREDKWHTEEIEGMNIETLERKIEETGKDVIKYREKTEAVENVDTTKWLELESYLLEQYNVIEDKKHLKHELQIEDYFKDDYYEYFECGQGYYQEEAFVKVHIGGKFYEVKMEVEIGSSKQDYGDRLYWVEGLNSITYKEINKPERKEVFHTITVSEKDIGKVIEMLKKEGIKIKEA